jgi:hypothetical protein
VLVFTQSAWAECGGWQRSAEARKACCGACQNDRQNTEHHDHGVTQQQADACCAKSEPRQSDSPVAPPAAVALGIAFDVAVPAPVVAFPPIARLVHVRTSSVPKHLLLSVLLV